jgi:alpha-glucosidase
MVCDAHHQPADNPRGRYRPAWNALKVTLPAGEKRKLLINGKKPENGV